MRQLSFNFSAQWSQHDVGAVTDDDWHESLFLMRTTWLGQPGSRAWWEANKDAASPGFRAFVETELLPQIDASTASTASSDGN